MDSMNATLRALGALQAINYEGQQQGTDVYDVRFENGETVWLISLSQDGKIATLLLNRPTFAQSETEHRLRQVIGELHNGKPDYNQMEPTLQVVVRKQAETVMTKLQALGSLQSITYKGRQQGADVYDVRFENGETVWLISLSPEGKIASLLFQ